LKPGPVPGFDLLTWAGYWVCSPGNPPDPGKTQEGQKMPGPGLWVEEKHMPLSRPSSITTKECQNFENFFGSMNIQYRTFNIRTSMKI